MRHRPSPIQRAILIALAASAASPGAWASPQGGVVAAGQARITQSPGLTRITQTSTRAVTNWRSFDIARGERVDVLQPSASAAMLARVTGGLGRSTLDGLLRANGQFFLMNPQGVIVGRDAVIDTGAFVATTLSLSDQAFMAGGALRFSGDSDAGIVNLGQIRASSGSVTLVGRQVANAGRIDAPAGSATLGAASEFVLSAPDQPAWLVRGVAAAAGGTGVDNSGLVQAARVQLLAAGGDMYELAVNQSGVVRATGAGLEQGRVVITAQGGTVQVGGTVSAHGADGSGGDIRIGGGPRGQDSATAHAAQAQVTASAVLDVDARAAQGSGGTVTVWSDRATTMEGRISARAGAAGGNGGLVEVSSARSLLLRPATPVDLRAPAGRLGTLLLDPDDLTITLADGGANTLTASALQAQLANGHVELNTSTTNGDIRFATPVTWTNASNLTVRSANNIHVDADITATQGALLLYGGMPGGALDQSAFLDGRIHIASGATVRVDRLVVGANSQTLADYFYPQAASGGVQADGRLDVNTLELDLGAGSLGITARHAANRIGALRTSGSGRLDAVDVASSSGAMQLMLAGAASTVQVSAPGDLTLQSGTALNLDAGGRVVLASTAGNVRNEAGSGAIGGAGSHLIYSGSASLTDKGGLGGTDEFSRSLGSNPPGDYTDGNSRFLFRASGSSLPQLTYRADNKTRLYGDANPVLSYSITDIDGPVAPSSLSATVSGEPALSTSAVAGSAVQTYSIVISRGTLNSTTYDFNFVNGQLTVQPAPLTFNTRAARRDYGDDNPAFTADLTGLKNGDSAASLLATVQFSTSATAATSVGDHAISIALATTANGNYSYTLNPGTLTIDPAAVTLSLAALTRAYGDANPDLRAAVQASGLKNGQSISDAFPSLSLSTSAGATSPIGTYAVSASGATNSNYAVTTSLQPLEVTRALLTVRADDKSRAYGDANPALTATITGFRNSETASVVSGLQLSTSASAASPVGSYAITASGASASNYSFQYTAGSLGVTAAPLQVTISNQSRVFGEANPTLGYTVSGLRNGDTAAAFSISTTAGVNSGVGNYAIQGSGTQANYSVSFTPGTLSVTRRPVLLTANDAARDYGDANPAFSFSSSGLLAADEIYRNYWRATTSAGASSNAGTYAVNMGLNPEAAPLVNIFTNLPNYDVQFAPGTLTVRRAPLTLVANPVQAAWGEARPALSYTVSGLRLGDSASVLSGVRMTAAPDTVLPGGTVVSPISDVTAPTPTPGRYPVGFAATGTAQNYQVTATVESTYTVLPRTYVVSVPDRAVDSAELAAGAGLRYDAPTPYRNGPAPAIIVTTDAPRGTREGQFTLRAILDPRLTPQQRQEQEAYYSFDLSDTGRLTVVPAIEPVIIATGPLTITPPATTAPPPAPAPLTVVSSDGRLRMDEMVNLMRDTTEMDAALRAFVYSDAATSVDGYSNEFRLLSDGERQLLLDLLSGKTKWANASSQLSTSQSMRNALMPMMTKYAMDLIAREQKGELKLNASQQRLVTAIETKLNEQRQRLIAVAEEKYKAWSDQKRPTLGALFDANFPDFVNSARESVLTEAIIGPVEGAIIGAGAVAGAGSALIAASASNIILPFMARGLMMAGQTAVSAATGVSAMAGGVIGGAVIAVAVVGTTAGKQAAENARNQSSYLELIASRGKPLDLQKTDVNLPTARVDVFNAIIGVMNDVF